MALLYSCVYMLIIDTVIVLWLYISLPKYMLTTGTTQVIIMLRCTFIVNKCCYLSLHIASRYFGFCYVSVCVSCSFFIFRRPTLCSLSSDSFWLFSHTSLLLVFFPYIHKYHLLVYCLLAPTSASIDWHSLSLLRTYPSRSLTFLGLFPKHLTCEPIADCVNSGHSKNEVQRFNLCCLQSCLLCFPQCLTLNIPALLTVSYTSYTFPFCCYSSTRHAWGFPPTCSHTPLLLMSHSALLWTLDPFVLKSFTFFILTACNLCNRPLGPFSRSGVSMCRVWWSNISWYAESKNNLKTLKLLVLPSLGCLSSEWSPLVVTTWTTGYEPALVLGLCEWIKRSGFLVICRLKSLRAMETHRMKICCNPVFQCQILFFFFKSSCGSYGWAASVPLYEY